MELDSAQDRGRQLAEEYKSTYDEIIKLTNELAVKCQQMIREAEELEIPIIKEIRKELNFPFDEQAFREMLDISNRNWDDNLQKFIANKEELHKEIFNKFENLKEPPKPTKN